MQNKNNTLAEPKHTHKPIIDITVKPSASPGQCLQDLNNQKMSQNSNIHVIGKRSHPCKTVPISINRNPATFSSPAKRGQNFCGTCDLTNRQSDHANTPSNLSWISFKT